MDLNHLHLHVKDIEVSRAFYETHLGFRKRTKHGPILFLTNDDGFDLALAPDPAPTPLPPWFHVGVRLARPDEVRDAHRRLTAAGVTAESLIDDDDLVAFRARDPDGYAIEFYWEP